MNPYGDDPTDEEMTWWSLLPSVIVYGSLCFAALYLTYSYHPSLFDRPLAPERKQELDAERQRAYARLQTKLDASRTSTEQNTE
ncbi:hypothetical protein BDF19DRAFT_419329 [Syncephalis fuscata]|nr:hypothetical protein BDF19DRAFT_419329 [Syncephalis fuscata]